MITKKLGKLTVEVDTWMQVNLYYTSPINSKEYDIFKGENDIRNTCSMSEFSRFDETACKALMNVPQFPRIAKIIKKACIAGEKCHIYNSNYDLKSTASKFLKAVGFKHVHTYKGNNRNRKVYVWMLS